MKVLLLRDLLRTAHHFPPYHIGSSLGTARFRGDYRFIGFFAAENPAENGKAAFPVFRGKPLFYFPKKLFRAVCFQSSEVLADFLGKFVAEVIVVILLDFVRFRRPASLIDIQQFVEGFGGDVGIFGVDVLGGRRRAARRCLPCRTP